MEAAQVYLSGVKSKRLEVVAGQLGSLTWIAVCTNDSGDSGTCGVVPVLVPSKLLSIQSSAAGPIY